ncbi:MAG: hypothetical protein M1297_00390 [Nitrospirae bacterium]|nr:hypothetical protein [Nitrospirota bacterium]
MNMQEMVTGTNGKYRWVRGFVAFSAVFQVSVIFPLFVVCPSTAAEALTKPVVKKNVKENSKAGKTGKVFSGILLDIDLKDHPMTLTVENRGGSRSHFVFGGEILPRTLVWKNGKSVGVKALKKGDHVRLVYRGGGDGPQVTHVRILP